MHFTRHQRGFKQFTRPAIPLACGRPDGTGRHLGFPPSFAPRRPGADNARRGGDRPSSTDLKLLAQHHIGLILQSCSSLTACDLASQRHKCASPCGRPAGRREGLVGGPALPRLREPPMCLLGGPIYGYLQAHVAVARVAEQPPASTPASLLDGTSWDGAPSPEADGYSANCVAGAYPPKLPRCRHLEPWLMQRQSRCGRLQRRRRRSRRSSLTTMTSRSRLACATPVRATFDGRASRPPSFVTSSQTRRRLCTGGRRSCSSATSQPRLLSVESGSC
jgi:hypothetical protein